MKGTFNGSFTEGSEAFTFDFFQKHKCSSALLDYTVNLSRSLSDSVAEWRKTMTTISSFLVRKTQTINSLMAFLREAIYIY